MDPYMLEDLKEFGLMWDGFPWIRGFSQISVDFEIFVRTGKNFHGSVDFGRLEKIAWIWE